MAVPDMEQHGALPPASKPRPPFCKDEAAWEYVRESLHEKGRLTLDGNPVNYGQAVAMYKHVVEKFR